MQGGGDFPRTFLHIVEKVVVMGGIVMGQKEALDVGRRGDLSDVRVSAVAPVFLGGVLFGRVLGIVNHNVGILHESGVAAIAIVQDGFEPAGFGVGTPETFPIRLVIAKVQKGDAIGFDPIAKRDGGMIQKLGCDTHSAEILGAFAQIPVFNLRAKLAEFHRKVSELHLTRENFRQRTVGALRTADGEAVARNKQRGKKRETLNMIPVSMTQEDGRLQGLWTVRQKIPAQRARAGAAIEDKAGTGIGHCFYAGRIAAIAEGGRAWRGDGTASSPKAQQQRKSPPVRSYRLSLIHISEPTRQAEISYAVFC